MAEDVANLGSGDSMESSSEEQEGQSGLEGFSVEGMLHQEYTRAIVSKNFEFDRILRIAGIGFSAAGALVFLIAGDTINFGEWSYWIAPLILTLLYALIIENLYSMGFHSYYARDLEDDLAKRTGVKYLHYQNTVSRALFSPRTAEPRSIAVYALILLFAWVFYAAVVLLCFVQIHSLGATSGGESLDQLWNPALNSGHADVPFWREVAFLWINGLLMGILLWSASGTTASLRPLYEKWKLQTWTESATATRQAGIGQLVIYAILPRRFDFLLKSLFTIASLAITALILRVELNAHLFWIGFWVVFCVDFLAKQTTYIWNDLLDARQDSHHSYKSTIRPLGRLGTTNAKYIFIFRTVTTFTVAFVLRVEMGIDWLPWLVGFIFALQFFYDRWAKRWPLARLTIASIGYVQRSCAGGLAVMATTGDYDLMLLSLLSLWIVVCQIMVLAEFWWAERVHSLEQKRLAQTKLRYAAMNFKTENIWFLAKGQRFEKTANVLLFPIGMLLAFLYTQTSRDQIRGVQSDANMLVDGPWKAITRVASWFFDTWMEIRDRDPLAASHSLLLPLLLGVVGIAVTLLIRMQIARDGNRPVSNAMQSGGQDPVFTVRGRWFRIWLAGFAIAFVFLPLYMWMYILVFSLPIIGAINYQNLTWEKMIEMDKSLTNGARNLLPSIDWFLFQPWALRINVYPVNHSGTAKLDNSGWAEALHRQYLHQAPDLGYKVLGPMNDGHGQYDLVIYGGDRRFRAFRAEGGFHVRCYQSADTDLFDGDVQDVAWVELLPMSIPTRPSMGHGLELRDPHDLPEVLPNWKEALTLIGSGARPAVNTNKCVRFYGSISPTDYFPCRSVETQRSAATKTQEKEGKLKLLNFARSE